MSPTRTNPFPGLRPFEFHEHGLFFGREEQYEQMADKLSRTRFLAVVGTSGSGKSSLVRAGLLPALCDGLMSARTKWRMAVFRPKDDPIRELSEALNRPNEFTPDFDWNGSALLSMSDILDWPRFIAELGADDSAQPGRGEAIRGLLPPEMRQVVSDAARKKEFEKVRKFELVEALNQALRRRDFRRAGGFEGVSVTDEAGRLLSREPERLSDSEVQRLNRLLLESSYPRDVAKYRDVQTKLTEVTLRRGDRGLVEAVRQARLPADENLIVVVDQFEELFRYARISENGPHGNQAAAFVKLLLQARGQREFPIYVVLTMRSDYLGDCAKFWDLPEAINESQYLIPRLTRDQRREAIKGPVKVRGADITPQLVNQLLNDMGDSPDQLPVLQHALMRTWDRWEADREDGEPINVRHYEAIGTMADALSLHADEAYNELPDDKGRGIAEKLFKCLTERRTGEREIRRPTELREISSVIRASHEDIVAVINVFRREGRSFLLPTAKKPIKRTTSIDISHESLIRNWKRLAEWVNEEAKSADTYRRLAESAQLYKEHRTELLAEVEVPLNLEWREKNEPNRAWASRYHPYFNEDIQKAYEGAHSLRERKARDKEIFERAMAYLEESRLAVERKADEQEQQRRNQLWRTRFVAVVLLAAILFGVLSFWAKRRGEEQREKLTNYLTYVVDIKGAQAAHERENFASEYELLKVLKDSTYDGMRGLEWDLLARTRDADWESVLPHGDAVLSATFLQDGHVLAVVNADGSVKLWENNGKEWVVRSARNVAGSFSSATFSPDGKTFASVDPYGRRIRLWNTLTGEESKSFEGALVEDINAGPDKSADSEPDKVSYITTVAFSPDEKFLACIYGKQETGAEKKDIEVIQLWDTESGRKLAPIPNDPLPHAEPEQSRDDYTTLAFSPDGKTLALGSSDGVIKLWDINSPQKMPYTFGNGDSGAPKGAQGASGHRSTVKALAFSPKGDVLAVAGNDGSITLWRVSDWKALLRIQRQTSTIMSLAFSGDGQRLAAARVGGSVKLWDTGTGEELATLTGHAGEILSVALSSDAHLIATVGTDKDVRVWDINRVRHEVELKAPAPVIFLALLSDGGRDMERLVLMRGDSVVQLWDTGSGVPSVRKEIGGISSVAVSEDKKTLATQSATGEIDLWDIAAGELKMKLADEPPPADMKDTTTMAFSRDGRRLALWSRVGGVKLYNIATGAKLPTRLKGRDIGDDNMAAVFSPDLDMLALVKDRTVELLGTQTAAEPRQLKGHSDGVTSITFSPDGREIATGNADKTVKRWDVSTGREIDTLRGHDGPVVCLQYYDDGTRLATGSTDGTVKLWDVDAQFSDERERLRAKGMQQELITVRDKNNAAVVALALSPQGKTLVTSTATATSVPDNTVRVW